VTCRAPGDEVVTVRMRVAGEWMDITDFIASEGKLTYRDICFKR
jgi:hypothetical protein